MRALLGPKSIGINSGLEDLGFNQGSVVGCHRCSVISMLWKTPNVSTTWRACAAATLGWDDGDAIAIVGARKTAGTPWRGRYGALGEMARWWSNPVDMRSVHT